MILFEAAFAPAAQVRHGFSTRYGEEGIPSVVTCEQVHGTEIAWIKSPEEKPLGTFDVLLTREPGVSVAVKTADCLPILLWDERLQAVGAIHAGWRGLERGILPATLGAMAAKWGSRNADLAVLLGPAIGFCCFEVGLDVATRFHKQGFTDSVYFRPQGEGKFFGDLRAIARHTLVTHGVREARIFSLGFCTFCRSDLFYSYRRDGGGAGRQINFIQRR